MPVEDKETSASSQASPRTEGRFPGRFIRSESLTVSHGQHLPQWTINGGIYSIAFHLADSIPAPERAKWLEIRHQTQALARSQGRELTNDERALLREAHAAHIERYLQAGAGACVLKELAVAALVAQVLEGGQGRAYQLHEYCIMPNHVHVIFSLEDGAMLKKVLSDWKGISSHRVNALLGRQGSLWMTDSYNRIVRTQEEYQGLMSYVWMNPESAGLKDGFLRKRFVE